LSQICLYSADQAWNHKRTHYVTGGGIRRIQHGAKNKQPKLAFNRTNSCAVLLFVACPLMFKQTYRMAPAPLPPRP
jgi:hypothetical protein